MHGSSSDAGSRVSACGAFLLAVLTLLAHAGVANAGINSWTPLGPDGGYIFKVVFHPGSPNIVYAKAAAGFFRSSDGGAHWQQPQGRAAPWAYDFAVDPTDGNRVYLVSGRLPSHVLVSTDAGLTFSTLHSFGAMTGTCNRIAISSNGTLYAFCSDRRVFRSTDRGISWKLRAEVEASFFSVNKVMADPSDPNTLYAVFTDELLATHDAGATWANIAPTGARIEDFAIDPADSNRLWIATLSGVQLSTNGGASWSLLHNDWITAVAVDPRSPSVVYAAGSHGYVLRLSGAVWSDVTSDLGSFWPHAIWVSPHDSAKVAVANARGLWITTNGGGNWARSDAGLASGGLVGFASSSTRNRIYTHGNALARLDDGSDTVTEIDEDALFGALNYRSSSVSALAPVSDSSGTLIAAAGNRIARSLDDGITWSLTGYTSVSNDVVYDLAATTTLPSVYYAGSAFALKRSTDQGATWSAIGAGLPAGQSPGVFAIAPGNPSVLYAGPRDPYSPEYIGTGVYKSTNGGDSWTPANAGIADLVVMAIAIHPTNPDVVYIGTSARLMKTVNGGASWVELRWSASTGTTRVRSIAIDPRAPDIVYVAGSYFAGEIARSTDGGATWTQIASDETGFAWGPTALAIDSTRPDTLRVGTARGGIRQITFRPDLLPNLAIQVNQWNGDVPLHAPTEYNYTISNLGPGPSGGVEAAIELPANVTGVTATPTSGTCTVASSIVTCSAPPLIANATFSIAMSITPTSTERIDIAASVHTDRIDAQSGNDSVKHSALAREMADVSVAINPPASAQIGTSLQYTVTATNSGPSPATRVHISYQSPGGMTLGTFSVTAGSCSTTGVGALMCEIGTLNSGASVTLSVTGTVAAAGTYRITAAANGMGLDANTANNLAEVSTIFSAPQAPPQPPGSGGSSSGGGGGGGAMSPLALLGLLAFFLRRGARARLALGDKGAAGRARLIGARA